MEQNNNGNGAIIAVLVVVVIVLVGWFAYKQGYLGGSKNDNKDIQINLPGTSPK